MSAQGAFDVLRTDLKECAGRSTSGMLESVESCFQKVGSLEYYFWRVRCAEFLMWDSCPMQPYRRGFKLLRPVGRPLKSLRVWALA
jgi:hypothetical protein